MEYKQAEVEKYLKDVDLKTEVVKVLTTEMESLFKCPACQKTPSPDCPDCLTNELETLVEKALEMTDDQITGCLLAMKSTLIRPPTGDVVVGTRVKRVKGKRVMIKDIKPAEKLYNQLWRSSSQPYKGNVTWGMWRSIVEVEALNREIADIDLGKVLSAIAKRVNKEHPEADEEEAEPEPEIMLVEDDVTERTDVTEEFKIDKPKSGLTAAHVTPELIKKVLSLKKQGMGFHQIELELGLRDAHGMTAYRIYHKHKKAG